MDDTRWRISRKGGEDDTHPLDFVLGVEARLALRLDFSAAQQLALQGLHDNRAAARKMSGIRKDGCMRGKPHGCVSTGGGNVGQRDIHRRIEDD